MVKETPPKRKPKPKPKRTPRKIQTLGRTTTESVHKHTGKHWDDWIRILDKAGCRHMKFSEITKTLKKFRIGRWWEGAVAMGYEMHIGRRIEGRNQKGEYALTATKTLPIARAKLWEFLISEEGQLAWLRPLTPLQEITPKAQFEVEGGIFGEIRTQKEPERIRLRWQDTEWPKASTLNLGIAANEPNKSILYFMHEALPSPRLREQMREYWKQRLEDVRRDLEKRHLI